MNKKEEKNDEPVDNSDSASAMTNTKQIDWSPENELIMVEWCDVAQCYKWLNTRSHQKYSKMHAWFTIPAIVLSTVSGTASFAQASLPKNTQVYAPMVIGTINIMIGILTTIQQYLKISELNESHRVSAISWDKFARNIRIELAKAPQERMDAGHFLKLCRQEFDRLMETSPSISAAVILEFNTKFAGKPGSEERKRFDDLKKPDICDVIITSNENRHHWYKELHLPSSDNNEYDLKKKETIIEMKEAELKKKEEIENKKEQHKIDMKNTFIKNAIEIANKVKSNNKKIDDYVTLFSNMYGRKPLHEEITTNFKDDLHEDIVKKYLEKYTSDNNEGASLV